MKLGDQIQIKSCAEGGGNQLVTATVVYIHPQRRYYTAEYQLHPDGPKLRESFPFVYRRGDTSGRKETTK